MADETTIISNLPTHTPAGSDYLAIEDGSVTGKNTVNTIVAAAAQVQTNASNIATNTAAISQLNSKFVVAGDVASVQFGVTDTNLQIRLDCAARGVYFFNIHRGTAQVSLMRTYNGQTTTIWTLT